MGPNTEMKENKPKDNGNKLYYKKKMASINLNMCNYNKCVWAKFTF